jgi:hypothetical protein
LSTIFLPVLLCGMFQLRSAAFAGQVPGARLSQPSTNMAETVRHNLARLPYYDVFDYVRFDLVGPGTVILTGEVTRPALKADAETVVSRIAGVQKVVNRIEVLPASPSDEAIRWAAFKAIFEKPSLQVYAIQNVSPLRIIVANGKITLDGRVASKFDRTLIEDSARSVPGVVSVIDNLTVG